MGLGDEGSWWGFPAWQSWLVIDGKIPDGRMQRTFFQYSSRYRICQLGVVRRRY